MVSQTISTRQLVFNYLRDHPIANNEELYRVFPGESENTIRQYKKQYFDNLKSQVDLDYTPTALERLDVGNISLLPNRKKSKPLNTHFITLLKTYHLLPFFIYSKLYERIKSRYGEYDTDYSYYDLYIELFDHINTGDFNNEIFEFFSNMDKYYGHLYYEIGFDSEGLDTKEGIDTEQEWIDIYKEELEDDLQDGSISRSFYNWAIKYLEDNNAISDHLYFKREIEYDCIEVKAFAYKLLEEYKDNLNKAINQIRIKIFEFLYLDFEKDCIVPHHREGKYNLRDIHKFCMEYNQYCNNPYDIIGVVKYYNDRFIAQKQDGTIIHLPAESYIEL